MTVMGENEKVDVSEEAVAHVAWCMQSSDRPRVAKLAAMLRELRAQLTAAQSDLQRERERVKEVERDNRYCRWKLELVIPVFQEARDALCALSGAQIKMHNIRSDLAARMDDAGTADVEQFAIAAEGAKL